MLKKIFCVLGSVFLLIVCFLLIGSYRDRALAAEEIIIPFDKIVSGASSSSDLLDKAQDGLSADKFSDKDFEIKIGDLTWTAVYLTVNNSNEPILDLWLKLGENNPWLNADSYSRDSFDRLQYPINMYSVSDARSYLVGSQHRNNYDDSLNSSSLQLEEFRKFLDTYQSFLEVPANVPYQKDESSTSLSMSYKAYPNESYGDVKLDQDYSSKAGYTDWQKDYLWLPSLSEVGEKPNEGIWKLSKEQRGTSESDLVWLRTGETDERMPKYQVAAISPSSSSFYDISGNYAIRPAIHLNLSKLKETITVPSPNDEDLQREKIYDGTALEVSIPQANLFDAEYSEGATFTVEDDTGTFSSINAGDYTLTLTPKENVVWDTGGREPIQYRLMIRKKTLTAPTFPPSTYNGAEQTLDGTDEYSVSGAFKDAGTHHATVTLKDSQNYQWENGAGDSISVEFKIEPKPITVTIKDVTSTYGDKQPSFTYTLSDDPFNGDELNITLSCDETNAGTYQIQGTWNNDNYHLTFVGGTYKIEKATVEVPASETHSYNGQNQTLAETAQYSVSSSFKDAGKHKATLTLKDSKNYQWADGTEESVEVTFEIVPKEITVTIENISSVYGDPCPIFSYELSEDPFEGDDLNITLSCTETNAGTHKIEGKWENKNYKLTFEGGTFTIKKATVKVPSSETLTYNGQEQTITGTEAYTSSGSGKDVGKYSATLTLKDSSNYQWKNGEDTVTVDFEILPKPITVTIANASSVYGETPPKFEYSLSDKPFEGDNLNITLSCTETDAGEYQIQSTWNNDNYDLKFIGGTYTIEKATVKIPASETLTYNGKEQTIEETDEYTVSGSYKDAGTHSATVTLKDSRNYQWENTTEESVTVDFEILPKPITVKIDDVSSVYGENKPDFTYTLSEDPFNGDELNITLTCDETNAGEHKIEGSWKNTNYHLTFEGGIFTIEKATVEIPSSEKLIYNGEEQSISDTKAYTSEGSGKDVGTYQATLTLTNPQNYKWSDGSEETVTVEFRILPKSITVTINNASSVYGDEKPSFTYTLSENPFNDDDLHIILSCTESNAGTHKIEGSWNNKNYKLTFVGGTYIIEKATVKIPASETLTYNGEEQTIAETAQYSVSGSFKEAGKHSVILTLKDTKNYSWSDGSEETVTVEFRILSKQITVKINDISSVYGEAQPIFTYSLSSQPFADDDLQITLTCDETNAGTYTIQGDWDNTNYNLTFIGGIYTIEKATIELPVSPSLTYNGEEQTLAETEAYTSEGSGKNVGTYTATLTLKDSQNYKWSDGSEESVKVTFEIVPKEITVTIKEASSVYGDEKPDFTYTLSTQPFAGDDLHITLSCTETNAGTYTIEGTWKNTNYKLTFVGGTYTIEKATVKIPASETLIYNGEEQTIEDAEAYTSSGSGKDVGTYTATLTLTDTQNYKWENGEESVEVTFEIFPKEITVTIANAIATYGETPPKFEYTLSENPFNGDELGISLSCDETNAGEHKIEGTWKNDNYHLTFVGGIYTIEKATVEIPSSETLIYNGEEQTLAGTGAYSSEGFGKDVGTHHATLTLRNPTNYKWSNGSEGTVTVEFEILPKPITVTINDASSVYGGEKPNFSYTLSEQPFEGDELGITLSCDGINAGTYQIQGTWNNSNYALKFVGGTYIIEKATVKIPASETLTYNGKEQTIEETAQYSVSGAFKDAGKHKATLTLKDPKNYQWENTTEKSAAVEFEIVPKEITVTIKDASSVYGNPHPKFSYELSEDPFNGDDLHITLSCDETNAGEHKIEGKWENKNYDLKFEGGTYIIEKATVEVPSSETLIYNGEEQTLAGTGAYTSEGFGKDVGTHHATLTLRNPTNYKWSDGSEGSVEVTFEIVPKPITVTIENASSTYGEAMPKFEYKLSDKPFEGDELGISLTCNETNAGTYSIQGTWKNKNYHLTFEGGIFTIEKATVTIPVFPSLTYNGQEQTLAETAQYSVSGAFKNAGKHQVTLTLKDSSNYQWENEKEESVTVTFEIVPKEITVTIKDVSSVYGEARPEFTYSLSSQPFNGDDLHFTLSCDGINAGEYQIRGEYENFNYKLTFEGGKYSIAKAKNGILEQEHRTVVSGIPQICAFYGNAELTIYSDSALEHPVEGQDLKPGTYYLHVLVPESENYEAYETVLTFRIEKEKKNYLPLLAPAAGFALFFLILLLRKRSKEDEE